MVSVGLTKKKNRFLHPHKVDEESPSLPGHCVLTASAADRVTFSNMSLSTEVTQKINFSQGGMATHSEIQPGPLPSQLNFRSVYGQR